jgi:hypothetical protein
MLSLDSSATQGSVIATYAKCCNALPYYVLRSLQGIVLYGTLAVRLVPSSCKFPSREWQCRSI